MSRPGQTGEPSMEDILASIRKIIAEEPGTPSRPVPSRSTEAFASAPKEPEPSAPAEGRRQGGLPLSDLTEALNATFGTSRKPPDDDLADLLDDAPESAKIIAEPPRSSLSNRLGGIEPDADRSKPDASKPAGQPESKAVSAQNGAPQNGKPAVNGKSEGSDTNGTWSHSRVTFKPSSGDEAAKDAAAGAPHVEKTVETSSSLGDVRPQSSFPASMSVRSFKAAFPPGNASTQKSDPPKSFRLEPPRPSGDVPPAHTNGAAKSFDMPSFGSGVNRKAPEVSPAPPAEKSEPQVIAAMPSSPSPSPFDTGTPSRADETPGSAPAAGPLPGLDALTGGVTRGGLKPGPRLPLNGNRTAPEPAVSPVENSRPAAMSPPTPASAPPSPAAAESFESVTTKAAVSALDALAAGLAASSGTNGSAATPPAVPLPESVVEAIPVSSVLTDRAIAIRAEAPTKTMEDTVAELLKPLLREWLAENMPRMLEKALRSEAADGPKRSG